MNFFKRFFGSLSRPTPPVAPPSAAGDTKPPVTALNATSRPDSASYDLFISYSRRDNRKGRVSDFVSRIQEDCRAFAGREQLSVFFDSDAIKGMDDWEYRILNGIRSSRLLLVFLSPNYLESKYCYSEFNEYLKHETARALLGEGIAPIYIVEIPGWSDKRLELCVDKEWVAELRRRQHFDFRPWFDEGAASLKDRAVKTRLDYLNDQIRDRLGRIRRVIDAKGNVDRHNEHFVGRASELRRLRESVDLDKVGIITAVHGLGGIGKTALAIEYAHAFAHEYPGGRWQVRCEGREDLRAALVSLAGARDLEFEFTEAETRDLTLGFERVLTELKKRAASTNPSRVLLLFDNVDQPKLLEPAQVQQLPQAEWLSIIATTRLGEHDLFGRQKDRAFLLLDELPESDALGLIEQYQPGGKFPDEAAQIEAREIVVLLGRLTLAVEVAAVYLGQFAEVSCAAFCERMRREGLTGLEGAAQETTEGVRHAEKSLSATLRPTLERLNEAERLTLTLAALLPADHVTLPWIRVVAAEEFAQLGKDAKPGYPDPWQGVIRRLYSLRVLQATAEPNEAHMHRLLQEVIKREVAPAALEAWERRLFEHIKARAEFLWEGWVRHDHRWELGPLAACVWQWMERETDEGAELANAVAGPLHSLGRFTEAEPLMRRALAIDEANFGPEHPNVARDLNNLAQLLEAANRLSDAEPLYCRALGIDEASYAPHHPDVARDLNNLAGLLYNTNRLPDAEPLMRRALAIDEASFTPDHSRVAIDLNNLAQLLKATNRLSDAEPLMRRALAIDEANFGPEHPMVAGDLNNLGELLYSTNRLSDAEPLLRRALAIDEASLGHDHTAVARDLGNLAELLRATNRLGEAEPLKRRALQIDEKNFGPAHPNVAIRLNNLALLLHATNQLSDAEPLYRRALAIDEASFGPSHSRVAIDLNNLSQLLRTTNRLSDAEPLMRRALAIDEASFGPDHPRVARDLDNLALMLQATNRFSEAEPLMRRALAIDEASFEPGHPNVAIRLSNLAQFLHATNRLSDAEPLMRRALAIDEASFGLDHPRVASDLNNLAAILYSTNRFSDAEPLMHRALAIDEASFGSDHPDVARDLNNLAQLFQATNRLSDAEPLMRRALAIDEASFGPDHPRVASDLNNLALFFRATSRLSDAELSSRRYLEILLRSAATGPEHPNLHAALANYCVLLEEMGSSAAQIRTQLEGIGRPFGMQIDFGEEGK